VSWPALALALLAAVGAQHLELAAPPGSGEMVAVLTGGGRPPAMPWGGLTESHRELLWALGCRGAQVCRTSWSGYLIRCPSGTSRAIMELADSLASTPTRVDTTAWSGALDMEPRGPETAFVLRFCPEGEDTAGSLPLRSSRLLSGPADTVVVSGSWPNSVILWGHADTSMVYAPAWRGLGTEVVATEQGCFLAGVCSGISGSPADLEQLLLSTDPMDSAFAAGWGGGIELVERAIARSRGPCGSEGHVLWLRGLAGGGPRLEPWRAVVMPPPPAYPARLPELPEPVSPWPPPPPLPSDSGLVRLPMASRAMDEDISAVAAVLLERMAGSLALRGIPEVESVWLASRGDSIWLEGRLVGDEAGAAEDSLLSRLRLLALAPPSRRMVDNCAVRASFLAGRTVSPPARTELIEEMLRLLEPAGPSQQRP
jgi:hypothetical protein